MNSVESQSCYVLKCIRKSDRLFIFTPAQLLSASPQPYPQLASNFGAFFSFFFKLIYTFTYFSLEFHVWKTCVFVCTFSLFQYLPMGFATGVDHPENGRTWTLVAVRPKPFFLYILRNIGHTFRETINIFFSSESRHLEIVSVFFFFFCFFYCYEKKQVGFYAPAGIITTVPISDSFVLIQKIQSFCSKNALLSVLNMWHMWKRFTLPFCLGRWSKKK